MLRTVYEAEKYKLSRNILLNGQMIEFYRNKKDEFNQPTEEIEKVKCCKCLVHSTQGYRSRTRVDGGNVETKGQPMLLMMREESENLKVDDFVIILDKKYKINALSNIGLFDFAIDISLEEVL